MNTDLKLLFYVKRTEVKQDGSCPVMGRITIGRTMAQFSAKLTVPVSLWDTRAGKVSGKSKQAVEVNRSLDRISVSINSHYRQISGLKGTVTATEVKNAFQGIASAQETLVKYFAQLTIYPLFYKEHQKVFFRVLYDNLPHIIFLHILSRNF
ncbi:hypothetical protein FACS189411_05250 [Bacteroidia bacterium]|nr:hypothetical protein FACS189411_05250 [Bacteroidia bacterium]